VVPPSYVDASITFGLVAVPVVIEALATVLVPPPPVKVTAGVAV
jgi:hypothetical protein